MPDNHLVIMAGGIGSRFWPLSSSKLPKQFIDVLGCGLTLIQLTAKRFEGIVPAKNIWVVTSADYCDLVYEQLPDIPKENVLLEPVRRNTAPCICYASWKIKKQSPRANIIVTPSDHIITEVPDFRNVIEGGLKFASETDAIVTIGIRPTHPETGYGYIKADLTAASPRMKNIFRVDMFKEKPTLEVAKEYLRRNVYFWNSGIFIWSVSTIVNAFRIWDPEISELFESRLPYYGTDQEQEKINEAYEKCPSISVDYAILERSEDVYVYPASFGWSDLGSWGSLRNHISQDKYGNASIGEQINLYDSFNCIVHTENLKKVVVQGLDGYIVAEKEGTLLICKLSEEQRIKLFHD